MKLRDDRPFFYQIPQTKRGVVLAVVATVLAVLSLLWVTCFLTHHHQSNNTTPVPGPVVTVTPAPKVIYLPTSTPAKSAPRATVVHVPGKTKVVTVHDKPVPAPAPTITVVPAPVIVPPAAPEPASCLDLTKLLSPGCKLL